MKRRKRQKTIFRLTLFINRDVFHLMETASREPVEKFLGVIQQQLPEKTDSAWMEINELHPAATRFTFL